MGYDISSALYATDSIDSGSYSGDQGTLSSSGSSLLGGSSGLGADKSGSGLNLSSSGYFGRNNEDDLNRSGHRDNVPSSYSVRRRMVAECKAIRTQVRCFVRSRRLID